MDSRAAGWCSCVCLEGPCADPSWRTLPQDHVSVLESKDVVRMGMGLVSTMAALVLGLLVSFGKRFYDRTE